MVLSCAHHARNGRHLQLLLHCPIPSTNGHLFLTDFLFEVKDSNKEKKNTKPPQEAKHSNPQNGISCLRKHQEQRQLLLPHSLLLLSPGSGSQEVSRKSGIFIPNSVMSKKNNPQALTKPESFRNSGIHL